MALIEVNPDLKAATHQLERIADALHALLREAYGIHLEPVKVDTSTKGDKLEVLYSDDLSTFKNELLDVRDGLNPDRPIDVSDPEQIP